MKCLGILFWQEFPREAYRARRLFITTCCRRL